MKKELIKILLGIKPGCVAYGLKGTDRQVNEQADKILTLFITELRECLPAKETSLVCSKPSECKDYVSCLFYRGHNSYRFELIKKFRERGIDLTKKA